jgi:cell division initiation protein
MALTALDIQQQRFATRLRGLDPKEVETFLTQAATAFEELQRENHRLGEESRRLLGDIEEYRRREGSIKLALLHSQKVIEQMQKNARKQADLIVAEAENKATRLLHQSQKRLAQLQDEIRELKRERVQFEVELDALIETHRRLIETRRQEGQALDEQDGKLKVLKP